MPTRLLRALTLAAALVAPAPATYAICGFYVAKADSRLFNEASQVVIARPGDESVISMVNDYRGDPRGFALVVPVPQVLAREQIHVADRAVIEHLDAYTAPRPGAELTVPAVAWATNTPALPTN